MKKVLLFMAAVALSATAFGQSRKVVVTNSGEPVGYYVKTNATTYTVEAQDDATVPIKGHKIVIFSAENGQGVVTCKRAGSVNVRSTPSASGNKVGTLRYEEGDMPETAQCLGKENGWYKVRLYNNKVGYIRQDLVDWEAIDLY